MALPTGADATQTAGPPSPPTSLSREQQAESWWLEHLELSSATADAALAARETGAGPSAGALCAPDSITPPHSGRQCEVCARREAKPRAEPALGGLTEQEAVHALDQGLRDEIRRVVRRWPSTRQIPAAGVIGQERPARPAGAAREEGARREPPLRRAMEEVWRERALTRRWLPDREF